ncbi:LacI family DNA-binding transcriptional regulator [Pseudalkalibacillus salsuginis]|uniref:LacI family DNA-binding transcriptional regulator n=1 Tax=Pseudalkalibacillus salsuginis TaxID=2910972 RepID=UPI001F2776A2|nr:LacI family DNA-binding transcriptional regulator [Pseudalkalibacillus salsuginis]MCF6408426.1 LacI family transcriptional regulator [Pseudalkalibacillus salsuginis]
MGVTIKDIAKYAGVSYSTVSKALRDSPLVKEPTKKRIIQIANQLGYQPNVAARSLVSKKSFTIGIVWPTIERAAHSALITSINKRLEEYGYTTLISINEMKTAIDIFNRYRVDAILVFDDGPERYSSPSSVPIVTYGIAEDPLYPTVDVNRKKAIFYAVDYLCRLGHMKICYIGDLKKRDHLQKEKVEGFKQAVLDCKLETFSGQLIPVNGLEQYDGYVAAKDLLRSEVIPSAIVSGSHDLTRGILQAIHESELLVPEDISIISYDNIPEMNNLVIPFSTVGVPLETITEKLTEVLMDTINNKEKEMSQVIYLEPELHISQSCRPIN